jgi:hypothetical protein
MAGMALKGREVTATWVPKDAATIMDAIHTAVLAMAGTGTAPAKVMMPMITTTIKTGAAMRTEHRFMMTEDRAQIIITPTIMAMAAPTGLTATAGETTLNGNINF